MNIVVTGAQGFVGKNVRTALENIRNGNDTRRALRMITTITSVYSNTTAQDLENTLTEADFIVHLAGVNRPKDTKEFEEGNTAFTEKVIRLLQKKKNHCPVLLSSSTQAEMDNPYGKSKLAAEEIVYDYSKKTGAPVYVYRFPNLFGKWGKPNYNSVVATFCHNIARDLPITITDPDIELDLAYIDDVVTEILNAIEGKPHLVEGKPQIPVVHSVSLGRIASLLQSFKESRANLQVPDMSDPFEKKLYATYLSYLPTDAFAYDLKMNVDHRGSFTEIIRTPERGQFSVNISKPGITKGQHWHHTKNEKFLVVSGEGVIRFRSAEPGGSAEVHEYFVSGEHLQAVDIPTGYTHNIENLGDTDLVTFMWANESFDPDRPDTYYLEV